MELMPHVKALLDDLIKMTKHITVKRTDLANRHEDNTRTVLLYQQVSEILYGMPSFFTYTVYPKEVLNEYGKWVEAEYKIDFGPIEPLISSENVIGTMSHGSKMTISNSDHPKNGKIGEGWVKLVDSGNFYLTKSYPAHTKTFNYKIYNSDKTEIIPRFILGNNFYDSKNLSLYIKDNLILRGVYEKNCDFSCAYFFMSFNNYNIISIAYNYDDGTSEIEKFEYDESQHKTYQSKKSDDTEDSEKNVKNKHIQDLLNNDVFIVTSKCDFVNNL